ncbi:MAG: DNA-3-methyladenine glycosylase [Defluviitaleaceae bacterium]|nr:DNA-3-methyladenine glycosylase [Defluviitaleaceae bacterium]
MRLSPEIYTKPAIQLAPLLLGKTLCRQINNDIIRLRITETEAYAGESDTACHAHKGKTPRTAVMYEPGGIAYIYLCYGIHNLLNVVAANENEPEAVLIRAVEGISGPGRLTKAMQIDRTLNRESFIVSEALWLEEGEPLPYITTPRIGINYASEEDKAQLWRFLAK